MYIFYRYFILLVIITIACGRELDNSIISNKKELTIKKTILNDVKCVQVKDWCNNLSENDDMLIIECLQSLHPSVLISLNNDCQLVIWNHTRELLRNDRVYDILNKYCASFLNTINCKVNDPEEDYLKCIVSNKADIHQTECNNMVLRLEGVAFQDDYWISTFLKNCIQYIKQFNCLRLDSINVYQTQTLSCLQEHITDIKDECQREVIKLSELQADNIKFDQQLYVACNDDHKRYCQQYPAGSGQVFTCLMKLPPYILQDKCRLQLQKKEFIISQDYRVSKGLMKACKADIKKTHCRRQTSNDKSIRLAQILLCLENIRKNGTKLDPECDNEIIYHRKMLMEDYRLSPEIVGGCKDEIKKFCFGLETGGKTIHCLMDHVRLRNIKKRIGLTCQKALEDLIRETDAGEDWRVDPILYQACNSVSKALCRDIKGGHSRVMSCLMDNIGTDEMNEECENALIQIQYFIARDFTLDSQLFNACKNDSENLCHASKSWNDPSYGPEILPCLYRYVFKNDLKIQLEKSCLAQIQRIMRQRAVSVDLQPEIEEMCLNDLASFCVDKTKKGEEMLCLQRNLEQLNDKCHEAVESFTEIEAENVELNPYIMNYCRKEMKSYCGVEMKNDHSDIMECLISHKNDPAIKANQVCRASIEHFQLISLKDYRFTYKFKISCKPFLIRFCSNLRTKSDVVKCLSEKITNDTIKGLKSNISKDCKQQLKAQLFQQRENIDFNPNLKKKCLNDIKLFCPNLNHGNAQVLECLQGAREKLSSPCEQEIFQFEKQEFTDNSLDYTLVTLCGDAIEQYCPNYEKEKLLDCLKVNRDKKGFSKKCRLVIIHRMIEQNSNYQLNPSLRENCKLDIAKFCSNIFKTKTGKDLNGAIIKCLRFSFKKSNLSFKCENELVSILREQALDISLNPLLKVMCKNELNTICTLEENGLGEVEECLKNALMERKIPTPECQVEVSNMIEESQADIQVDPLLQQVCALDLLKNCYDVPQGNGRHIKCLIIILNNDPKKLSNDCKTMLNKRVIMYENAAKFAPLENLHQLYYQVSASPSRHYFFLIMLTMLGSIFIIGIFFGRAFKRHSTIKNK